MKILSEVDRLLDEALKIIDEKREKENETADLYEDYRADIRDIFAILGSLMSKMYADRVFDPEDRRALTIILESKMKRGIKHWSQ
jgi:DNA-binding MarR family transcriptional regulator